jgi:hypothetical protein
MAGTARGFVRWAVLCCAVAAVTVATTAAQGPAGTEPPGLDDDLAPPSTAGIEEVGVATQVPLTIAGQIHIVTTRYFRNTTYPCGASGHHTFLLAEPVERAGQPRPLLGFIAGGQAGYRSDTTFTDTYGPWAGQPVAAGGYYGLPGPTGEAPAAEIQPSRQTLEAALVQVASQGTGANPVPPGSTVTDRVLQGWRVLIAGSCDSDANAGVGGAYPNRPGHTVDGALATAAAIEFSATITSTGRVFLLGHSTGAIGAFAVTDLLASRGVVLNGTLLDSGLITTGFWAGLDELARRRCTDPPQPSDPPCPLQLEHWSTDAWRTKVGAYFEDSSLIPAARVAAGMSTPLLLLGTAGDPFCRGACTRDPEMVAAIEQHQGLAPHAYPALIPSTGHMATATPTGRSCVGAGYHDPDPCPQESGPATTGGWLGQAARSDPPWPYSPREAFTDVTPLHPWRDAVSWMTHQDITQGFSPNQCGGGVACFKPTATLTRQAISAFLYRLADEPPFTTPAEPSFSDVGQGHPFFHEIEWMAHEGITTGYADGTFRPGLTLNRAQTATFLYRITQSTFVAPGSGQTFSDVPRNHPFFLPIEWASATGVDDALIPRLPGDPPDTREDFDPGAAISRGGLALDLFRLASQPLAWPDQVGPSAATF